jgi:hypothetical protein
MGPDQFRIVMNILAFGIGNLGGPDLFIILLIVLVLFGAKKLPDLSKFATKHKRISPNLSWLFLI